MKTFLGISSILFVLGGAAGCDNSSTTPANNRADSQGADGGDASGSPDVAWQPRSCTFSNPASVAVECKDYRGGAWTLATAEADCAAVLPGIAGSLGAAGCDLSAALGSCTVASDKGLGYAVIRSGTEAGCKAAHTGCDSYAGAVFTPSATCQGSIDLGTPPSGEGKTGPVFVQPSQVCKAPLAGEQPGQGPGGQVCTQNMISGATEFGRHFEDYGNCNDVRTQRPYWAQDPEKTTDPGDPRLLDAAFMGELNWARKQVQATACACCHTAKLAPEGPANWYIDMPGIWIDGLSDQGLGILAGLVPSSAFGAYPPAQNNGFDRLTTGIPTTDIARMQAFLLAEWKRRGLALEDAQQYAAFGGPLAMQAKFQPKACSAGEGVDAQGHLNWGGGPARYVYVLPGNAQNPGVPPNMDQPAGTLWLVQVPWTAAPLQSGLSYGAVTGAMQQRLPASGQAPTLQSGQSYYLYVLKDIGVPITRCLFQAP